MLKAPCKNCPDRHPVCHSDCEKYLDYCQKNDKRKEDRINFLAKESAYFSVRARHKGQHKP